MASGGRTPGLPRGRLHGRQMGEEGGGGGGGGGGGCGKKRKERK